MPSSSHEAHPHPSRSRSTNEPKRGKRYSLRIEFLDDDDEEEEQNERNRHAATTRQPSISSRGRGRRPSTTQLDIATTGRDRPLEGNPHPQKLKEQTPISSSTEAVLGSRREHRNRSPLSHTAPAPVDRHTSRARDKSRDTRRKEDDHHTITASDLSQAIRVPAAATSAVEKNNTPAERPPPTRERHNRPSHPRSTSHKHPASSSSSSSSSHPSQSQSPPHSSSSSSSKHKNPPHFPPEPQPIPAPPPSRSSHRSQQEWEDLIDAAYQRGLAEGKRQAMLQTQMRQPPRPASTPPGAGGQRMNRGQTLRQRVLQHFGGGLRE
ncbi:uncharacterized protein GGS25DRAFT_520780 [Hypoxylon fragiforme]|uniref:uncharacterized protein n=1 Tax=Hypoxylon fragiforme TaxID=63214 RepID=UPI0020C6A5B0|nr:uncharacterized protein GGS25DRAFT_520780 [Hypoxylon fragiforme]KAI2609977.1 hypothetical protein GGS25DRAFT_520780 [Hypoxylon fragiforme]